MRNFYLTLIFLFIISILVFLSSFLFLDKEKHQTYLYTAALDNHEIGTIKIDAYITEDKLLYKSISETPFHPTFTGSRSRIVLDRKHGLRSYEKENYGTVGASEVIYVENNDDGISFVATGRSRFAWLDKYPTKEGVFVFKEDSPLTYLPIIENYDFRKGRSQGFNAITHFSTFMPPMRRHVTLTSVRDEYLTIDSKNIKTEYLLLKIRNYPQGGVWVSKSDKSLVKIEIPGRGIRITREYSPKKIKAQEYSIDTTGYLIRDANFKNRNIQLSGTLSLPAGEAKYPGILLIGGDGPEDRQYQGLFASMADFLARNGYAVLRFDRRGIGLSEGDSAQTTDELFLEDINAAINYMKEQKEIDPDKMILIGHSKGTFYASKAASGRTDIKALILMAPVISFPMREDLSPDDLKETAARYGWSDEYLKLYMKSNMDTLEKTRGTTHSWASILGQRCFVGKVREEALEDPVKTAKGLGAIPALILQGKLDDPSPIDPAAVIDKALEEGGNMDHTVTYFSYMGPFLGRYVHDGIHRIHYEADSGVMDTMKAWLKSKSY